MTISYKWYILPKDYTEYDFDDEMDISEMVDFIESNNIEMSEEFYEALTEYEKQLEKTKELVRKAEEALEEIRLNNEMKHNGAWLF